MTEFVSKNPSNVKNFRNPIKLVQFNDILINPDYQDQLMQLNLTSFDLVWNFRGGDTFKKIPARSVTRIDFEQDDIGNAFYLKRHNPERVKSSIRDSQKPSKTRLSQGILELKNIIEFRDHDLATVIPVAAGEKKLDSSRVISFLITEDFSPFISLEWILFNRPEIFTGSEGGARKRKLLEKIGGFARKMHNAGFNHKDFNATHILLYYPDQNMTEFEIALFDLQRVDRKNILSFRWIIKSLAEINYTLLDKYFTAEDRQYLFLAYKGHHNPNFYDRFQQWWIRRKTSRIARHTKNIIKKRQSLK
jgi:hypothetical protein